MLYIERIPAAPLNGLIRTLWYAQAQSVGHRRERVLPTGCVQLVVNLAREFLLDCPQGLPDLQMPPWWSALARFTKSSTVPTWPT